MATPVKSQQDTIAKDVSDLKMIALCAVTFAAGRMLSAGLVPEEATQEIGVPPAVVQPAGEFELGRVNFAKHDMIIEAFRDAAPDTIKDVPLVVEETTPPLTMGTKITLEDSGIRYTVWAREGKDRMPGYQIEMTDLENEDHLYISSSTNLGDEILEAIYSADKAVGDRIRDNIFND